MSTHTTPATVTTSGKHSGVALRMRDVVLSFPDGDDTVTAVNHVSFDLKQGELVAITGPSGSGKSSLLAVASTLIQPNSGSVLLGDTELAAMGPKESAAVRRNRIGIVFQQSNLLGSLTAIDQLLMTDHLVTPWSKARLKGTEAKEASRARAEELLTRLDLGQAMHRTISALSGGQRQRVNIARALMHSPELLVVDEPTSALDSQRSQAVMDLLLELVREEGVGTLLVTHDKEAAARADRELVMVDGVLSTAEANSVI